MEVIIFSSFDIEINFEDPLDQIICDETTKNL